MLHMYVWCDRAHAQPKRRSSEELSLTRSLLTQCYVCGDYIYATCKRRVEKEFTLLNGFEALALFIVVVT